MDRASPGSRPTDGSAREAEAHVDPRPQGARRPARPEVDPVPVRGSDSSTRPTSGSTRSSSSAPGWPAASAAATLAELGYNVHVLLLPGLAPAGPLASPPRAASTPPRTTRTTATASTASSTTPSRAATSAPARPTSTGSPRCRSTSSTSASPRACRSPASTAGCSPTAPSAAPRCRAPSTAAGRPASNSCSARTRPCRRQIGYGNVKMLPADRDARPRRGRRPGARHRRRDLVTGQGRELRRPTPWCWRPAATATSSSSRRTRRLQRHRHLPRVQARGRVRQPVLHADPPDLHPRHRRPPVEAHADARVAAQRRPRLGAEDRPGDNRHPTEIPEGDRDYYLERKYPSFGNLAPRDIASRAAKEVCDEGRGVGPGGRGVYLDFADAIQRRRRGPASARSTATCSTCTSRSPARTPYERPMRIYPALHYTMGGLWVDYNLMSQRRRACSSLGEANFSDHGANRLGAPRPDAGAGRRLLRAPVHDRQLLRARPRRQARADRPRRSSSGPRPRSHDRLKKLLAIKGKKTARRIPPRARHG